MLKKILYTDSGTGKTSEMLKILQDIPSIKKAELTILHVVPPQITTEAETTKWKEGGQLITNIIKALNLDTTKVTSVLRRGDPKDTVCEVAKQVDADLILMGSRGLKRLEAILENSVSQYVFQLTDRAMLLVKDDIYVKKIKRIMVALNKSNAAEYTLDLAIDLFKDYSGCELILARVNPDLNSNLLPLSKAEMENNPILAPAAERTKRMGINTRCIVTGGKPGEQICNLAEEYNVDLLMIGSPERRPSIAKNLPDLDRLLGTSLSDYVRVNANCPVLLARKEFAE